MKENIENSQPNEEITDGSAKIETENEVKEAPKPRRRRALSFELLESTLIEDMVKESSTTDEDEKKDGEEAAALPEEFILPSHVFYDEEPLPKEEEEFENISIFSESDDDGEEHTVFMVEDELVANEQDLSANPDISLIDGAGHTYLPDEEFENEQFDFGDEKTDEPQVSDAPAKVQEDSHAFKKYDPNSPRKADTWFDLVEIFTFTLVAIIFISSFLFRHSIVDGDSMLNTLENGDHLIITDIFYSPKRGDIIVFEDYSTGYKKPLIKRVIATEGQTVYINLDGEVFVDGEKLDESEYAYENELHDGKYYPLYYEVPEGEVFVMGDHRCCSTDSRYFGPIKTETILGKVILRVYPFAEFGPVK